MFLVVRLRGAGKEWGSEETARSVRDESVEKPPHCGGGAFSYQT